MRYRIIQAAEADEYVRTLAPEPKRLVRRVLREMINSPYGPNTEPLDRPETLLRVRAGDYRIIFRPGPGAREISVTRIGHREWVYEGLERSSASE